MSNNPNVPTCLDAKLCINISLYWPDYGNISLNQTSDYLIWSAHRNELLQIVRSSESGNNFHNRLSQKTIEYFTTTNFRALFWNQNFWNLKFLDSTFFEPQIYWKQNIVTTPTQLLTWLWQNIKSRFLGTSLTDANCHGDLGPGNICPGNICPYQEYLMC